MESSPDFAWARQRVLEKLSAVELPPEATAELGPLATAYGEVYRYELRTDGSVDLMTLRELNDWVVIPRILRAPGVAEVSNFGGLAKQFSIELPPGQLRRFGMTFDDIVKAVETNNAVAGGSVMRRGGTSFVIRGTGSLQSTEEIGWFFVKSVVIVALRQRGKSVNFNAPGQCRFSCGWILGARQSKLPTPLLGNLDLDSVWTMLI